VSPPSPASGPGTADTGDGPGGRARRRLWGQNTQVFGVYPGPIDTKMGEVLTLKKASPADTARAIVAGSIAGDEEIFPDRMSQGMGPAFFADPKGLERQVAGVPAVA
jgi:NAD(P)-dependent dehydrogenase (short-subunit alcohol dehydrogenase family)